MTTTTGTEPRMIARDLRFSVAPMMDWTDAKRFRMRNGAEISSMLQGML